jgi:hypothetical protein
MKKGKISPPNRNSGNGDRFVETGCPYKRQFFQIADVMINQEIEFAIKGCSYSAFLNLI